MFLRQIFLKCLNIYTHTHNRTKYKRTGRFCTFSWSVHLFMNLVMDMLPVLFLFLEAEEVEEVCGVVGEFP